MKKDKTIFWLTTAILSLMMLYSAVNYLTNDQMKGAFIHLGFPSYFRIELALAKMLGAAALILPFVPKQLKQFAYIGFGITFISAIIAHLTSGDPVFYAIMPLAFLVLLAISYFYSNKLSLAGQP